jgi:hypothetical protein
MIIHSSTHVDIFLTIKRLNMKLCINCVHAVLPEKNPAKYTRCSYGNAISPVTGVLEIEELYFCQVLRKATGEDKCGQEGRFFEEKQA